MNDIEASNAIKTDDYIYVRTPVELESLIRRIDSARRIALDTEADSLHNYFEKVCLIQLSLADEHYLIDPLAGLDLADFLGVLAEKPLLLHGGDYDLRMLRASFGFRARQEVFDTMIAAQLLGFEQIGLAALIERYFAVTIAKTGQKSDWSRRPLSEKQLHYAVNDTRYLAALADRLADELSSRGRREWHRESCQAMVQAAGQERLRDAENAWRIKGSGRLSRRQLAYLRELWRWRDEHARRMNRPPFHVAGNQLILELLQWADSHAGVPLAEGPKLPRNIRGALLVTLEEAIARAANKPESEWPEQIRGERVEGLSNADLHRFTALRESCASIAKDLEIAASTLAPKSALEAIVRGRARSIEEILQCSGLLRWQAELAQDAVMKCLG
jgi:ribonuclease D